MKKENKTVRGLLKRLGICLAAGSMIGSAISAPGIVSAQELPTGNLDWETLTEVRAKDYVSNWTAYDEKSWKSPIDSAHQYHTLERLSDGNIMPVLTIYPSDARSSAEVIKVDENWNRTTGLYNNSGLNCDDMFWKNKDKGVFKRSIKWTQGGTFSGFSDTSGGLRFGGIFDGKTLNVGDKIRVKARIYPCDTVIYQNTGTWTKDSKTVFGADEWKADSALCDGVTMKTAYPTAPTEMVANMWLSNSSYNDRTPKADGTEQFVGNIKYNQWNDISFEYTVTEENKDIAGVRIDFSDRSKTSPCYYPSCRHAYFDGLVIERSAAPTGSYTIADGSMTGNVTAAVTDGAKMVVAAYSGNEMVGAAIQDCSAAESSYDFSIANVTAADKVIAYIWKLDNANPVLAPIPLTAN